jgi:hypothetical protein
MANTITVLTTDGELWRKAIRATLAQRSGGATDTGAICDALAETWSLMSALLKPVLGERGVDAIFRRSLYLTSITCPWITFGLEPADSATLLAAFQEILAVRKPDDAAEAAYTLLVNFTELLTTLIGASLTGRLLGPVWGAPTASADQEN